MIVSSHKSGCQQPAEKYCLSEDEILDECPPPLRAINSPRRGQRGAATNEWQKILRIYDYF
jgi:hypothetical protein